MATTNKEMAKMTIYYVTSGSVRGECGHHHRTISGALACLDHDQTACRRSGGYSDRYIRIGDSDVTVPTTRDDDGELIVSWDDIDGHPDEAALRDALTASPAGYPSDY